jgi:hypothetical protein
MNLELRVTTQTETYDVKVTFPDVCAWEEATNKVASDLAKGLGMRDLGRLAYFASRTAGRVVPAVYKDFEKTIQAIDVVEQGPSHPTPEALGATA